jgi:hypothetical protein
VISPRLLEQVAAHTAGIAAAHGLGADVREHWAGGRRTVLECGHAKWERRLEFYRAEFDAVPRRTEALRRLAAAGAAP